jgi:4-amino-4-deoxy-L-arabinose transferase-like glycosyltransferase
MKISKFAFFFWSIIIVAAFLRLWRLGTIPSSLTPDEAALGYNAYSILKTGKDEYGKFMPVIFKSFGDFKPGLYVYATVPFVWALGLSEVSVRLPSALSGILIVFLIYLIVLQFREKKSKQLAISAAFLSAVNPWLIYYSRGAWEANLSLCLTIAGIYFFLVSFKNTKYLVYSSVAFALTFWAYQGAKLSTLIVLAVLTVAYWNRCRRLVQKKSKVILLSSVLGLLIIFPVVVSFFNGQTGRLSVFSVFSYPRPSEYTQSFLDQGGERVGSISYLFFHSEAINFARGIAGRWYNHFSGKFLFFEGDYQNPMHSAPNSGMLLLIDLVLLPLGALFVIREKYVSKSVVILAFLWLILAPLPAILSRDQVQSVRALNMVIPLVIISSIGLTGLVDWISRVRHKSLWYLLFTLVLGGSLIYFLDAYFVHFPIHTAKYRSYGFKQVVQEITPIQGNYDRIIFQQSYDQPYIFFLFYQKYDPSKYQEKAHLTAGGDDVGLVEGLDNIDFEKFSWPPAVGSNEKVLIVGNPVAIPPDFSRSDYKLISEIKYPDSFETAFRILEEKQK